MKARLPSRLIRLATILAVVAALTLNTTSAFAETVIPGAPTSCEGVISGEGDPRWTVEKYLTAVSGNTLTYTVVTNIPDANTNVERLRDCVYLSGTSTFIGGVEIDDPNFTACGAGLAFPCPTGSFYKTFNVTVPEDTNLANVCDEVALSGTFLGAGFTDKSAAACGGTVIPVGAVGALGVTVLSGAAFALYQARRRFSQS